jgi:predicted RNA-binding protein with PUA-like domain
MPTFIFKTEPDGYSFEDLERDKRSAWTGVRNPGALIHLRSCRVGDEVLIYHTGREKSIVGLARVVKAPYEDPANLGRTDDDRPRFTVVDLAPIKRAKTPVELPRIKADARFKDFALVRQGRLSVMPVPMAMDHVLREWAGW